MRTMFRRISFFTLSACLMVGSAAAQQTEPPSPVPQSSSTPQPLNAAALKKLVGFLRVGFLKGGQAYEAAGTCFFVIYEDKRLGAADEFGPAEHVALELDTGTAPRGPREEDEQILAILPGEAFRLI